MNDWKSKMQKTVRHLAEQLAGIRAGTMSVGFLETFRVAVRGNSVPLGRVASIVGQGDRLIVRPFDPTVVPSIVKSLTESRVHAYALDPTSIAVSVPPISGEQRSEIARHVKKLGEESRIAIRSIRQDARKQIAARGRGSERSVQEATDAAVSQVESLVKAKLAELDA